MFGEMGLQDRSKIRSGLQSCGEEVSEGSDSTDGNYGYTSSLQSEHRRREAVDFGFIMERRDSLTDLGSTADPVTYGCKIWGKFFDHSKPVPIT